MILVGSWVFAPEVTHNQRVAALKEVVEEIVDACCYNRHGLIEGEWNFIHDGDYFIVTQDGRKLTTYQVVETEKTTQLVRL